MKLSVAYGTSTSNGNQTAAQAWGTYANMKVSRPKFCEYLESKGVTQAEALKCSRFETDMNEDALANLRSLVDASDIMGVFNITMPVPCAFQKFVFSGTAAYAGPGWVTGGICLKVDHTNWNKRVFPGRNIFPVNDWGQPANAGGNYAEGFVVQDVCLDGGLSLKTYDPTFESYGIAIRNSGSACYVRNVVANGFNNAGFAWAGGIPIFAENTRSFYNGRFGYHFIGTALSTGVLIGCETDDCGQAMFGFEAGYGQLGGGNLTIYSSKAENGKNLVNGAVRPMGLVYARASSGAITFVGFHSALYNNVTVPTAFDIQGSNTTVTVTGFNECGSQGSFTKLLTTASKSYGMTSTGGNTCKPIAFQTNCVTMTACSSALSGTTQADAIAVLVPVASIDQAAPATCLPATVNRDGAFYANVDAGGTVNVPSNCPPPVVPVDPYTYGNWGNWGYCSGGKQTRKRYQIQTRTCP